jgi:protein involved in polysaccharide export with SLBB domain
MTPKRLVCFVLLPLFVCLSLPLQLSGQTAPLEATEPERAMSLDPSGVSGGLATPGMMPMPQTSAAYKLGVSDLIAITVYQEADLSLSARISEDGTVVLPLLGSVKLGGRSVKEATEMVTTLYKQDYLVSPIVNISVMEMTKSRFSIMGQVQSPGLYELPAEGTIPFAEAIAMAGGYTRIASKSKITVKRTAGGQEQVFKINGKDQEAGDKKLTFRVQSGDVINVGESWF